MAYNKRQHLADNIAALEWIFMRPEFLSHGRGSKVLNGYSGFGGLKCILNPAEKDTDTLKDERQTGNCSPKSGCCMNCCGSIQRRERGTRRHVQSLKAPFSSLFTEPLVAAMQESLQVPEISLGTFPDFFQAKRKRCLSSRLKDIP